MGPFSSQASSTPLLPTSCPASKTSSKPGSGNAGPGSPEGPTVATCCHVSWGRSTLCPPLWTWSCGACAVGWSCQFLTRQGGFGKVGGGPGVLPVLTPPSATPGPIAPLPFILGVPAGRPRRLLRPLTLVPHRIRGLSLYTAPLGHALVTARASFSSGHSSDPAWFSVAH